MSDKNPEIVASCEASHSYAVGDQSKSRITYLLLCFFFGCLGIHNFYAKRTGCAIAQLLLTVLSLGYLILIPCLWCLVEMFVVTKDGNGVPFK